MVPVQKESDFPFHAQVHDSVIKNIAVFENKTLLEILLVGLNISMGKHTSISPTDLNLKKGIIKKYNN